MRAFDLIPRTCKQCGKKFEGTPEYAYKMGNDKTGYKYFCSYHCMRDFQKGVNPGEAIQRNLRGQKAI